MAVRWISACDVAYAWLLTSYVLRMYVDILN